ncbi:hypothetical protein MPH_00630 [Macrophomina phaseolina MS6]|uniref:AB hydrolase-1 domain-containing protein n=1 Tax=Macrophomina phaseolina (strain MS6) TaxID=1126212 RepID=K2SHY3_MACPH|nr:hypothetical protein MPH_00630 [Macrophomina phaseolina MS6]
MLPKPLTSLLAISSVASAAKQCLNQTISVDIESRNPQFDTSVIPHDNLQVTYFIQNMTRQGHNFTNEVLKGYKTITGTYNVSTQFCWDDQKTGNNPVLQILTHGIGFDKTYWDLSYNDFAYSYVDHALDAGYVTLSYDRLGIGKSQHGDPLNEIQANIEIAALRSLTSQLRSGSFPGVKTAYDTIVHVGHSFGSVQSYIFAHRYPDETQGIVLTGFALNSSFLGYFLAAGNFQLASVNSPLRFGSPDLAGTVQDFLFKYTPLFDYVQPIDVTALDQTPQNLPDGYIVPTNAGGNQFQFLEPPYFDVDIVPFIESSKQPVTLGEILTIGNIPAPNDFAGPVLVFTGDADQPFCGGDCYQTGGAAPSIPHQVQKAFPKVSDYDFTAYIQPATGHGITAHYNATGGYQVIADWLKEHQLA